MDGRLARVHKANTLASIAYGATPVQPITTVVVLRRSEPREAARPCAKESSER